MTTVLNRNGSASLNGLVVLLTVGAFVPSLYRGVVGSVLYLGPLTAFSRTGWWIVVLTFVSTIVTIYNHQCYIPTNAKDDSECDGWVVALYIATWLIFPVSLVLTAFGMFSN